MARYFLDPSALVKRYHQESGTSVVEGLFSSQEHRFFISRLALVEVHSAFARLVRDRLLREGDLGKLVARLQDDVAAGLLNVAAASSRRLAGASSLLCTHGLTNTMRTLDAIHLATAQALHSRSRIAAFVAADNKILAVASACGMSVLDVR
jgi:predicted nucleic acid-binding protein